MMPGVLVSVSVVRISPDLSYARAYLSVFPSERSEEIVKNINDNMKSIGTNWENVYAFSCASSLN